jgi:hypothetical protein
MKESYKLGVKPVGPHLIARDRLFFDRFQYCLRVNLAEASALRGLHGHDAIDRSIEIRRVWRSLGNRTDSEITDKHIKNLHRVHDHFFSATNEPFKMTVSGNQIWIYTNNLEFLHSFNQLPGVVWPTYSQAVIDRPLDTIRLKEPKHTQRTYLRDQAITAEQRQRLRDFFNNYHDSIRLSPSLNKWIVYATGRRIFGYYFVDHDDDGWLVLLNLLQPGLVRKTVQIIADK